MQSRRDQVQAYFFVVGRMVAAVTHGRPDVLQAPNRRLSTGTALGVLLAALLVGIFGIVGLFLPGGNSTWRQPGTIVMDKASGARFVYLDGELRPVLNYASARLVSSGGAIVSVSQNSLSGTPVGQPIGIPGAPDAVPVATKLDRAPWTVCVQSNDPGVMPARTTVSLLLGRAPAATLGDDQALLVVTPDGVNQLLWQGRRHRVADPTVIAAMGYGDVVPIPVSAGWLNPVPPGRDLAAPVVPGTGQPGPPVDGRPSLVGQVFEVRNPAIDSDQLYLLRADGVTALSRTTEAIVLASDATRAAYPGQRVTPIEVGPGALTGVPRSSGVDLVTGLPATPPEVLLPPRGTVPCARYDLAAPGEVDTTLELRPAVDAEAGTVAVAEHTSGTMADRVAIPVGSGVLAREEPTPDAAGGATFLVTDVGIRYPVQGDQAVGALGYSAPAAVAVPGLLLDLLPAGPVLSVPGALRAQVP